MFMLILHPMQNVNTSVAVTLFIIINVIAIPFKKAKILILLTILNSIESLLQ